MSVAVEFINVCKAFSSESSKSKKFWRALTGTQPENLDINILRNINLKIFKGESVAIIGKNGAGKSTLLKMLVGTIAPTTGKISCNGSISAILELGVGFNPEFTGRENSRFALSMKGVEGSKIEDILQKVKHFSGIGEYFEKPLRIYSTGMQARVAFSVASAIEPEILIVDEALSVGDSSFQHKSFSRIQEFVDNGCTFIFVSHDRSAVTKLCTRAILIDDGMILRDGDPQEVFDFYNAVLNEKSKNTLTSRYVNNTNQIVSGTGDATVSKILIHNSTGLESEDFIVNESIKVYFNIEIKNNLDKLIFGYMIKDRVGNIVFGTNSYYTSQEIIAPKKNEKYQIVLDVELALGPGTYSISTALVDGATHLGSNYEWVDKAIIFKVINTREAHFIGSHWLHQSFEILPR